MKSFLKKSLSILLKLPISMKFIKLIEEISQNYQGKGNGWSTESIENEVNNCLSLLKINPKIIRLFNHPRMYPIFIQPLYGYKRRFGFNMLKINEGIPSHNVQFLKE